MDVTLYTTHCPQCEVLEKKLNNANITFTINEDAQAIRKLGFLSAPILKVDDKAMTFKEACDWVAGEETKESESEGACGSCKLT